MLNLKESILGIEFGSTRIKAVLINKNHEVLASGFYDWESKLVNGIWTYSLEEIHVGLQTCYKNLADEVIKKYNQKLTTVGAIGISALMHGYFPLDKNGNILTDFRIYKNTITEEAATILSIAFQFNIPQRWSIAHLYQAILNKEEHINDISFLTTLAGYIHWRLTGNKVAGVGEASGMFPIDIKTLDYNERMLNEFQELCKEENISWKLKEILPKVLNAGENAGYLTKEGAAFLDPSLTLQPGIPFAPCEGDAGTGMVVTNSIRSKTCNVSAGTSDFAMIVMDDYMNPHKEVSVVTTPAGLPVAMVHCNNCTSDINAWANLFNDFAQVAGFEISKNDLFTKLYSVALEGEKDCGGLLSYNYYSGEAVSGINDGRPLFTRLPESKLNLANFMRSNLYSALSTLKIGMDILIKEEDIEIDTITAHGGYFKTPEAGQRMLSAAIGKPVSVYETAGEGGPFGMALLAAYLIFKEEDETLEAYLDKKVFKNNTGTTIMATEEEIVGFDAYCNLYKKGLNLEKEAIKVLRRKEC